ncbi:class I SAM-dependent methyltransferase [Xylanimonas protaetiae]|uniref:Class I SAM-dependent methyltransferase n=1 Tax=Xylanimonas protaetiae TaxID=2509457 RepID=A0A4V0YGA8_9MICO|nr:class I SAM-dependent methyltransferase [Xylanimonas protaetiae]QAY70561.1 class I SAM-dependent methyltransferase [Xylanimonas protaetiae]
MTAFQQIVRGPGRKPHHVVVRQLARGFDAVNAHVWWSHNDHFHGWVLRRLRAARGPAVVVDVGCGAGTLVAALRARGGRVVGIDPDDLMARTAAERFAADDGVTIARTSYFDLARGDGLVPAAGVRGLTMIASFHHLAHERGLEATLEHARALLAPGGRLVVVGLARPSVTADYVVDMVSVVLNPLMGLVKRAQGLTFRRAAPAEAGRNEAGMPVRDPDETYTDVAQAAARVLPGARVRRRLWFRYSLEWTAERSAA